MLLKSGTESRNRTDTPARATDFESAASTSSAIPAQGDHLPGMAREVWRGAIIRVQRIPAMATLPLLYSAAHFEATLCFLMKLSDFHFDLPDELIARHPEAVRSASRLLCVDGGGPLAHQRFADLPGLLQPGDLLVLNDTRVLAARLFGE